MKNTSKDSFNENLEENKEIADHEKDGMVGNPAEQHEELIKPDQPDLSDRPTNDPSVYPSDPNKGLTPNPLPSQPEVQALPNSAVHKEDDEKLSSEEILTRLLHIANVAHHAGNQFDVKSVGHALKDLAHLMHRVISEK